MIRQIQTRFNLILSRAIDRSDIQKYFFLFLNFKYCMEIVCQSVRKKICLLLFDSENWTVIIIIIVFICNYCGIHFIRFVLIGIFRRFLTWIRPKKGILNVNILQMDKKTFFVFFILFASGYAP